VRALLCEAFGPPESLAVREVGEPAAKPGEVVVDVTACGVNFPDTLVIEDRYQFKPGLPFSPGCEVSGVVSEVGEGVDGVAVGDAVLGTVMFGGMAERVAVPAPWLFPLADGADPVTAAALPFTYGTAHYSLTHVGGLVPGETVLVLGAAGGVGLATVDLARAMGATVVAAASSPEKLALCAEYGASSTVDYSAEDLRGRLKELAPAGVDLVVDPVGGPYAEAAVRGLAWQGRFVVVGFPAGIPKLPLNLVLLKAASVRGAFWGAWLMRNPEVYRRDMAEVLGMWQAGTIRPYVSATYPLERGGEAIRELADRRARGKVVVRVRD